MNTKYSLGILSIATNGYVKYLPDLVSSAARNLADGFDYCHYIFTDDVGYVENLALEFPNVQFKITQIPNLGWPDATLLRYEIYSSHSDIFIHDLLMHLDSDMYFLAELEFEISPKNWHGGMAFVEHPGYFKPALLDFSLAAFKARFRALLIGGFGDWETSRLSSAFTPRSWRSKYFCGGTWFGFRDQFINFCHEAQSNVNQDSQRNVVAKWHDESHLNYLVSKIEYPTVLSSRYCYEPTFGKLQSAPIILAINKSSSLENQLKSLKFGSK